MCVCVCACVYVSVFRVEGALVHLCVCVCLDVCAKVHMAPDIVLQQAR